MKPNHIYGILAGCASFWVPAMVMVYVYIRYTRYPHPSSYSNLILSRVYMEAIKLETLHGSVLAINNLQVAQENYESNPNGDFLTESELLVS